MLHVGRVFFVWTAFYAVLIFAVVRDFPSTWKNVLRVHLFLFAAADLAAVALRAVLAYAPAGLSSGFRLALHRSRLLNEFAAHERVAGFARDLFLLLISALLFPVLGVLVVAKHALAYAVFLLSTGEHATNSPPDTFYPSNVEFLESCLTFFQVRIFSIECGLRGRCHDLCGIPTGNATFRRARWSDQIRKFTF